MGVGDEILAAGEARRMRRQDARKVVVVGRDGVVRRHEVWANCPDIARRGDPKVQYLRNGPKCRPYIDYHRSTPYRWAWKDYKPEPADLGPVTHNAEARDCILVEPHIKASASPNKRWPYWRDLIKAPLPWVQVGPPGTSVLPGVKFIPTATIWDAIAVLAACKAAVLPEGGLHHAAAAVGTRAVVIYGGYISPDQTGYALHRNIFTGGAPCGNRRPCNHCNDAMEAISVEMVLDRLREMLC